jgi:hypothetical protein
VGERKQHQKNVQGVPAQQDYNRPVTNNDDVPLRRYPTGDSRIPVPIEVLVSIARIRLFRLLSPVLDTAPIVVARALIRFHDDTGIGAADEGTSVRRVTRAPCGHFHYLLHLFTRSGYTEQYRFTRIPKSTENVYSVN